MYSMDRLIKENKLFHMNYGIKEIDVQNVNRAIEVILKNRNSKTPNVGDIVEFTDKHGNYRKNSHIEVVKDNLYICENPYVPFVDINETEETYSTSTSGGAWTHIPKDITYIGECDKVFNIWGNKGPCSSGAIQFVIPVNIFEYSECKLGYSTKTHIKLNVKIDEELKYSNYKYILKLSGYSYKSFRDDNEYTDWLSKVNAIVIKDKFTGDFTLWIEEQ